MLSAPPLPPTCSYSATPAGGGNSTDLSVANASDAANSSVRRLSSDGNGSQSSNADNGTNASVHLPESEASNATLDASTNGSFCVTPFGSVGSGTYELAVPAETPLGNFTHFLVFARSSFVEQSTPAGHEIYDASAVVTDIVFDDKDLDPEELGGVPRSEEHTSELQSP